MLISAVDNSNGIVAYCYYDYTFVKNFTDYSKRNCNRVVPVYQFKSKFSSQSRAKLKNCLSNLRFQSDILGAEVLWATLTFPIVLTDAVFRKLIKNFFAWIGGAWVYKVEKTHIHFLSISRRQELDIRIWLMKFLRSNNCCGKLKFYSQLNLNFRYVTNEAFGKCCSYLLKHSCVQNCLRSWGRSENISYRCYTAHSVHFADNIRFDDVACDGSVIGRLFYGQHASVKSYHQLFSENIRLAL